ncbi:MAG: hypothetical protein MZV70_50210 [Desulfobacterales bacterium]|nr:hypothetical protein [Desulfobacterales bacterium]
MAVVANTMVMSVRERMHEFAVFKTLGYGGRPPGRPDPGRVARDLRGGRRARHRRAPFPRCGSWRATWPSSSRCWTSAPTTLVAGRAGGAHWWRSVAAAFPIRKVMTVRIVDALGRVA